MKKSPYLKNDNRLAEVISAIQVLSVYKYYKLDFKKWANRISGNDSDSEHWKNIFLEHPEFFRVNVEEDKASLVWRRTKPMRFCVNTEKNLSFEEFNKLKKNNELKNISRSPLSNSEIETLITTAINIHSRAIEQEKNKRWWVIPAISSVSGLVGVILGSILN